MMSASSAASPRDDALNFLFSRINYERAPDVPYGERQFKLDRMRRFLACLGNPDEGLPIVHIAGTKGKGSAATLIAAGLKAAGYRTGVFSSPHLERIEERLAIDGQPCSAEEFVALVARLRPIIEAFDAESRATDPDDRGLTYFEITTAMALLHFAERRVDWAVLEVGLGGRLDSTNVCRPRVAVITSISYDHMQQLGNTLRAIAAEKAGIVKPGVPVVSGVVDPEPQGVIEAICRERGSELIQLGVDFDVDYRPPRAVESTASPGLLDFSLHRAKVARRLRNVPLRMLGRHQAMNAAVALAVLCEIDRSGCPVPEEALRRGLAEASCPARVEVVCRRPTIVLDAAHNTASIAALLRTLDESFAPARRVLVFATTRDKDVRGMLELLLPHFDRVLFTRYTSNPRGVPPQELETLAAGLGGGTRSICADPMTAWHELRQFVTPQDLVCITGSFFAAAEMQHEMNRHPLPFPQGMALESA